MLVELDDIIAYLHACTDEHTQRSSRSATAVHGKSQQQVAFVLRNCINELQEYYSTGSRGAPSPDTRAETPAIVRPQHTYRNRATQ